ncbi:MAG: TetR/AcrR family transcriptional regulator [Desulfovibrionaceae bacterium]|nr:TetR/AcrR family transcriptional regulator [Desulfovibrionaceae bacterium]
MGAENLTVRGICEAANLSVGTFYHCFRDKDDLLMFFLGDPSSIGDRVCELYMRLIGRYLELGETLPQETVLYRRI